MQCAFFYCAQRTNIQLYRIQMKLAAFKRQTETKTETNEPTKELKKKPDNFAKRVERSISRQSVYVGFKNKNVLLAHSRHVSQI